MRMPGWMFVHSITVRDLAGHGPRGATYAAPKTRPAIAEEKASLAIDQRTDSPTSGSPIECTLRAIVHLEHAADPGSLVSWEGREYQIVNVERHRHRMAPEHAEMRGV